MGITSSANRCCLGVMRDLIIRLGYNYCLKCKEGFHLYNDLEEFIIWEYRFKHDYLESI